LLSRYDTDDIEDTSELSSLKYQGETPETSDTSDRKLKASAHISSLGVIFAVVAIWPAWSAAIDGRTASEADTQVSKQLLPESQAIDIEDETTSTPTRWQPRNSGHDLRLDAQFKDPRLPRIRAIAFVYLLQRQGKEMINSKNVIVRSQRDYWRLLNLETRRIQVVNSEVTNVKEYQLISDSQLLTVWQWYRVGDSRTSNALYAKLLEVLDRLLLRNSPSVNYMIAVEGTDPDNDVALKAVVARIISNDSENSSF